MKLNYNNTALGLLEKMDPFSFTLSQDHEHSSIEYKRAFGLSVVREWPKLSPSFGKKIRFISEPFHDAYTKAMHRLADVIDVEPINEAGTLISKVSPKEYNTIFYNIKTEGQGKDFMMGGIIFFFSKETDREKPSLCTMIHRYSAGTKVYMSDKGHAAGVTDISIFADILSLLLFLKYCDQETKIVNAKRREHHAGVKYVNETPQNIEILDSTWFTTIVRSEGFKVGGHFRMQPCGPERSQRKLIWISDFEKTGYTRTAKVLNQ